MKQTVDWDALRLFLAVARAGGLAGAARETGVSPPTLGRRMTALEASVNQRLFDRRQTGFSLTEAGHALFLRAQEMEGVASDVERWRSGAPRHLVRISAGSWTSRFLARRMDRILRGDADLAIDIATAHQRVDILRRQADIGIRSRPTDEPRIAGRRVNDVAYAVYRNRAADGERPWIGVGGDAGVTQTARWVARHHGAELALTCSDPRLVLDWLRADVGQAVLPCFVGDGEPELIRAGSPIEALAEQQWLALNEQARREPHVRRVIDRLVALLEDDAALFAGARPA